jgi:large subunit ribosomal protein L4
MTALTVTVSDPDGGPADGAGRTIELPAEIFGVSVNVPLIHQVVVAQLAAARQGTHDTKNRGEVSGTGRKPHRQKGTGQARQGSKRSPQFTGGGVAHGPTPRSYAQRTPKKMKAAALRGALSDRASHGRVHVVAGLVGGDAPSTKVAATRLAGLVDSRHVLLVAERSDQLTWKSLRNVVNVHLIAPDQLNTYDVLVSDDVVFTEAALGAFLAGRGAPAAETAGTEAAGTEAAGTGTVEPEAAGTGTVEPEADVETEDELAVADFEEEGAPAPVDDEEGEA